MVAPDRTRLTGPPLPPDRNAVRGKRSDDGRAESWMEAERRVHLIFLKRNVLLVKREELSWRELQAMYADHQASLGPWTTEDVLGHFIADYGEDDARWPFRRDAIQAFMTSPELEVLASDS
jgi:hypothetical protein